MDNDSMKRLSQLLGFLVIYFFLSACSNSSTPTISVLQESPQATAHTAISPEPTKPLTLTPSPTISPTVPTSVETLAAPSNTPTIPPLPGISNPQPSVEEIASALQPYLSEAENINLEAIGKIFYQDVNGDQQDDLIFKGENSVSIFVWIGDRYSVPYVLELPPGHYLDGSKISFEDWNNDSIFEVVFDHVELTGGSGLGVDIWEKHIIQCLEVQCHPVWEGITTILVDEHPPDHNGMAIFDAQPRLIKQDGHLLLEQDVMAFTWAHDVYSSSWMSQLPASIEHLTLDEDGNVNLYFETSMVFQRSFIWTGNIFEFSTEEIIQQPTPLAFPIPIHEATSPNGITVKLHVDYLDYLYPNKTCQLIIQEVLQKNKFGCLANTTVIEWKDITNDSIEEIVVTTLAWPYSRTSELLTEKDECIHQRLIAYQWNGTTAQEIANVNGCVVQSNFFGVRLEDLDGDGQVEIIAADKWKTYPDYDCLGCYWYEFIRSDQVYTWDGRQFVYQKNIPRK